MVTTKPLDIEGQLTSVSFDLLSDETNDDNELQPEFNLFTAQIKATGAGQFLDLFKIELIERSVHVNQTG